MKSPPQSAAIISVISYLSRHFAGSSEPALSEHTTENEDFHSIGNMFSNVSGFYRQPWTLPSNHA